MLAFAAALCAQSSVRRFVILVIIGLCIASVSAPSLAADKQTHEAARYVLPQKDRVDLNHATLEELLKVPGLTRTWAERILRFRPYRTRLDLLQQGILPPAVYNRIKDAVIVHREVK